MTSTEPANTDMASTDMANTKLQISYVELPAANIEETKRFYNQVFGWEWREYAPTYAAYEGGMVEVGLNASALAAQPHQPGAEDAIGPLVLLASSDVETKQAEVIAAGGEIISPVYPYPGGRRFHFQDPSGNILGVYQSDSQ